MRTKLTPKAVESVKAPKAGRLDVWDKLTPGLHLRITEHDHRTWNVVVWTGPADARRQRRIKLGHPRREDGESVLTLAEARDKAREVQKSAAEGKLDGGAKEVATTSNSFRAVAAEYLKYLAANRRPVTVSEARRVLELHDDLKAWRDLPIANITPDHVREVRDRIARRAPISSNRTLARVHAMFRWAVDEGRLSTSPAAGIRKAKIKEDERDRVLGDDELRWFWIGCDELEWPFGPLCQLLLLTAQRRDEVAEMCWSEVKLGKQTWTLPKHRAKNGKAHLTHLSDPAVEILTGLAEKRGKIEMLRKSDLVFTTNGVSGVSGFSRAKRRLDAAMLEARDDDAEIEPWTLHDLRRSAATGMAGLNIPPHVVDKILNHSTGTIRGVAAVYNRHQYLEERQNALDAWGRFLMGLVTPQPTNVTQLRTA